MAVLLKKNIGGQKGLIVFTHKEWPLILKSQKLYLKNLKKLFYIGIHSGWYLKDINFNYNKLDFIMSTPSLCNVSDNLKMINLCSRNFIPETFKDFNFEDRYFDICAINRPHKVKHTIDLLLALKKEFEKGSFYKVLVVLPKSNKENKLEFESDLMGFYNETFSHSEKQFVTIIRLSSEINFLGLPQSTISWFLNNSKCFFGGSSIEGTCKAVHEAVLCGCKVIYYKFTKSAIPDFLNEANSVSFENYQDINLCLPKAVKLKKPNVSEQTIFELSSKFTREKIIKHFAEFYKSKGEDMILNFENLSNLSRLLPAHDLSVRWFNKNGGTADIRSKKQLIIFNKSNDLNEFNSNLKRFPIDIRSYKFVKNLALIKKKYFVQ